MIPVPSTTAAAVTKRTEPLPEVDLDAILDETLAEMEDEGQPVLQPPLLLPHAVVPDFDVIQDQKEQMVCAMRMSIEIYRRDPEVVLEQMKQNMRMVKDQISDDGGYLDRLKLAYEAGELPQAIYETELSSLDENDKSFELTLYLIELGIEQELAGRMAEHPDIEAILQVANLDVCSRHEELFSQMIQGDNQNLPSTQDKLDDGIKEELVTFLKRHLGE